MLKNLYRFGSIVTELSQLLRMKFIEGNIHIQHPIGKMLRNVLHQTNLNNFSEAEIELARLEFLVLHLKRVQKYDERLLKDFRNYIIKHPENFLGIRFELGVCASLLQKDINFIKRESPDFLINDNKYKDIFIECGSSKLSTSKENTDINYKIGSVINKKGKKKYANESTALFLDITNIVHNLSKGNKIKDKEQIKEYTKRCLDKTNFGNITLFTYLLNPTLKRYESGYIRIDNGSINSKLLQFMDEHYPLSSYVVEDPQIPNQS